MKGKQLYALATQVHIFTRKTKASQTDSIHLTCTIWLIADKRSQSRAQFSALIEFIKHDRNFSGAPAVDGLYYCWTLLQPIIANLQLCGPPASSPIPPPPPRPPPAPHHLPLQPLQGDSGGGVDKCNSWCKLSFYPMIMV